MINPAAPPSALPKLILPQISAGRREGGATVSADSSTEQQLSTEYNHHPSSMTGQLNHSLRAWTEMGHLINMFGQRTIRLGAEDVRSRVRDREDDRVNSTWTAEQDESPPTKRRRVGTTSNSNDNATDDSPIEEPDSGAPATPDVIADAQQIKRMAIIFSKMKVAHEQFRQELESFVDKAKKRSEEELSARLSQEEAQLVKTE
mmetsp:Transcript_32598/g.71529  ORF Transcript_32598/g.71529 Transcript_32598/m.71529 type:complete len:203 (-) Transcript_32598:138-746(-)